MLNFKERFGYFLLKCSNKSDLNANKIRRKIGGKIFPENVFLNIGNLTPSDGS